MFKYKNIFLFASLQFCGHIEEYFSKHTERLVVLNVLPRIRTKGNLLRVYKKGHLELEKQLFSRENILLYYSSWYISYWILMLKYFKRSDNAWVICGHPLIFLGSTIQKILLNQRFVYWVGDYFPPVSKPLILFERLKKYYHDRIEYSCYLSDTINSIFNKTVLNTAKRKTVMWGVTLPDNRISIPIKTIRLLFIGQVVPSQGLELIFNYLQTNASCSLSVIGLCEEKLYKKYLELMKKLDITKQVYFPNKFLIQKDIEKISSTAHAGIAFYALGNKTANYYTDPGKVKAYIELGLPVIMTNTSAIVPYIKNHNAGIIVLPNSKSIHSGITKLTGHYEDYQKGVMSFAHYFEFEKYYESRFKFLEI